MILIYIAIVLVFLAAIQENIPRVPVHLGWLGLFFYLLSSVV